MQEIQETQHKSYTQGAFLDALDTQGAWCVSFIKRVHSDCETLDLGFVGWAPKYDL
jgi:hypothetical protein